jgi:predicted dinucleotide-binding enzyme
MPDYRPSFLEPDGAVARVVVLVCGDDKEAIRAAQDFADGRAMELREGGRLVRTFEKAE